MFDRVIVLLLSGSGAALLSVALFMLIWRWSLMLRLEIGWTRRGWLRAPALLVLMAQSARQRGPLHERIKLGLMLVVAAVTAPLLWLAFIDAITGIGLLTFEAAYPSEGQVGGRGFALALAACLTLTVVAWLQFTLVLGRKEKVEAELAAYIAEGEEVLGTGLGETPAAELSRLATAVLVVWAGIGQVGIVGACATLWWGLR